MRRPLFALAAAGVTAAVLAPAAPALAHPLEGVAPTLPTDLTHARSNNVDYLGRFPEHFGTAGGVLRSDGKVFFITDPRGVHAYDVSSPENPVLLSSVAVYQQGLGAALAQEDPDTDGTVLLVDGSPSPNGSAALQIVDVSNPKALKIAGSVPQTDHTWECISGTDSTGTERGCAYAYGRTGHIVDIRTPSAPRLLPGVSWKTAVGYSGYTHDLNEIRPGLVQSAGKQAVLMDTRNPVAPKRLLLLGDSSRFPSLGYHSTEWARGGTDRWVVAGTEISPGPVSTGGAGAGSDCEGPDSVIETWDASAVLEGLRLYYEEDQPASVAFAGRGFVKKGTYDAGSRGLFLMGQAPSNVLYCAHWMEQHPRFADSGLVAVAYYDRGVRFVQVDEAGTMKEIGWITAAEGYAGSVQWINDSVAYIMDYRRGLEVVKLRSTPATHVVQGDELVAATSGWTPPAGLGGGPTAALLGGAALSLLLAVARRRRSLVAAA